jgi:hypothetical protein
MVTIDKVNVQLPKPIPDHAWLSISTIQKILTILLYRVLKERQSIIVGLAKVCASLAPIMQFYFYRIDRKLYGHKMVKGTCLAAPQRKTLLESLVLEILGERLERSIT